MRKYTRSEWRDLEKDIYNLESSLVWEAIEDRLKDLKFNALNRLQHITSTESVLRVAQGEVNAYNCAIMVLKDLRRLAAKNTSKGDH